MQALNNNNVQQGKKTDSEKLQAKWHSSYLLKYKGNRFFFSIKTIEYS